ncbi:hypothetical protein [Amycolatopsis sp. cmx-11-32]|uniref:hypothetical protein n=1 Tax=Amycolatopsis sp. cmx-11-32 TaxID=2785796 RepID=UPI0039E5A1D6
MNKRGRWAEHPELLQERSRHGVIKATALESLEKWAARSFTDDAYPAAHGNGCFQGSFFSTTLLPRLWNV